MRREEKTRNGRDAWRYIYNDLCEIYIGVFEWGGLPDDIDSRYVEYSLMNNNNVTFYQDELIGLYLCLKSAIVGIPNVYGNPTSSRVYGVNGYSTTVDIADNKGVVIYDNLMRVSPLIRLQQFASYMYELEMTSRVNVKQQKTPRIIKTTKDNEFSVNQVLKDIDNYRERVVVLDSFSEYSNVDAVLTPAPFVTKDLRQEKKELWNEILNYIGVVNNSSQKAERLITQEVTSANALPLAKLHGRFEARQKAVERINNIFGLNITVKVNSTITESLSLDGNLMSTQLEGVENE